MMFGLGHKMGVVFSWVYPLQSGFKRRSKEPPQVFAFSYLERDTPMVEQAARITSAEHAIRFRSMQSLAAADLRGNVCELTSKSPDLHGGLRTWKLEALGCVSKVWVCSAHEVVLCLDTKKGRC